MLGLSRHTKYLLRARCPDSFHDFASDEYWWEEAESRQIIVKEGLPGTNLVVMHAFLHRFTMHLQYDCLQIYNVLSYQVIQIQVESTS